MNWTFDKLGLNSPHYGHDSMMHSHWNRPCHCCKLKLILNTKIVISQKHDIANEFLRISNIRMPRIFFPINICEGCRTAHQSKEVQIGPIWRRNFVPGKRQRHSGILTQVSAQDHLQPPTVPEENKLFQFCFRTIEEVKQVFKSGEDPTNFQWGAIGKQLFWNNLIWRYLSLCFFIFLCITMKNVESFQSCESHYNNLLSENWIKSTSSIQFKS